MDLPVRILDRPAPGTVISVDGTAGVHGLELSHWPGNRTPAALRHELSTGSALAFARLPPAERARLAAGAEAIVNNHYDTDGALAMFAVRHPEVGLAHADALLAAAAAGDFFRIPSERALALDAVVTGLADAGRSPLAAELAGRPDAERRTLVLERLFERLPALLAGDLGPWAALAEPVLERAREDLADLDAADRADVAANDLTVFRLRTPPRAGGPGRHALFTRTRRDRALVLTPTDGGHAFRLVVSTLSWFDTGRPHRPRPDLPALAAELNALEGAPSGAALAWRAQDPGGPSPELWFGAPEEAPFAEHAPLTPSALDPARVLALVERYSSSA